MQSSNVKGAVSMRMEECSPVLTLVTGIGGPPKLRTNQLHDTAYVKRTNLLFWCWCLFLNIDPIHGLVSVCAHDLQALIATGERELAFSSGLDVDGACDQELA